MKTEKTCEMSKDKGGQTRSPPMGVTGAYSLQPVQRDSQEPRKGWGQNFRTDAKVQQAFLTWLYDIDADLSFA
ncbi:hypothetical protein AVEN_108743-1 [Araneus ventricosus]|uniref:Uncharacterized protein n=1 Tax=Araneus ventricosus TaxID=182803 RepID=A0A4Y2FC67_ARAVE|nr:hypothetical protein AVEN_108743-1 [Araneus ventricosus]